jgi:hypothetical protein
MILLGLKSQVLNEGLETRADPNSDNHDPEVVHVPTALVNRMI